MSHYVSTSHRLTYKNETTLRKDSIDRWSGLSNLSRYLLESNTLHDLMDNAARAVIEILELDFCHILTLESNNHYYYRASYAKNGPENQHPVNVPANRIADKIFHEISFSEPALVPYYLSEAFTPQELHACAGVLEGNIWLVPLAANTSSLGFLVLGKTGNSRRDQFVVETTHLVDLIAGQLSNAILRVKLNENVNNHTLELVQALNKALEARDLNSGVHSQHMANLSAYLAQRMGCSDQETTDVYWAALLHDIGKIAIEDKILRKPGKLDEDEWNIMKQHPQIGAKLVQGMAGLDHVAPLILTHHERLDGSGYPSGLRGDQIPLGARIIAVVDSYTSIIEGRPYKERRSPAEAISELTNEKGKLFDGRVVDAFIQLLDLSDNTDN